MPTDILIDLRSHERPLSTAARALGDAGINIDGLSGPSTVDDLLVGHLLVVDHEAAGVALERAGVRVVGKQEVLIVDIEDRPGALAQLYDKMRDDAGNTVSVAFAYMTCGGQIAMGTDTPEQLAVYRTRLGLA